MADRNLVLQLLITARDNASAGIRSTFDFIDRTTSATANKIREAFAGAFSGLTDLKVASDFEEGMARIQAVMRPTTADFDAMREKAEQMGRETRYTATEAAAGLEILAKAGFTAAQAISALEPVLNLAQGAGIGLADAAGYVSDSLTQFGLAADQSARVTDVLSKAANSANQTVGDIGQAFKYVGPAASQAGLSIERTAAMLDVLAQSGLRADMAGTGLRDLLQDLNNPASAARESLYKLGINTNNLSEAIDGLKKAGPAGAQAIQDFGVRSAGSMRALVQAGTEGVNKFEEGIRSATGYAQKSREIMDDTFKGAAFALSSAWEGVEIALKSPWLKPLQDGIRSLAGALNALVEGGALQAAGESVVRLFQGIGETVKAVAANMTALVVGLGTALAVSLAPVVLNVAAGIGTLVSVVRTMGLGMAASTVATNTMTAAMTLFNRAVTFLSGPVGLLIGALTAGAAAMALFWEQEDKAKLVTDALAGSTEAYIEKLKEQTAAQNKVDAANLAKGLDSLHDTLNRVTQTYDRMNGKVGETVLVFDELDGRARLVKVTEENLAEAKVKLEKATSAVVEAEKRRGLAMDELARKEELAKPGMEERNRRLEVYQTALEKATAAEKKAADAVKNTVTGTNERSAAEAALIVAVEKTRIANENLAKAEGNLDRERMNAQKGMTANVALLAGTVQQNTLAGTSQEALGKKLVDATYAWRVQGEAIKANAAAGITTKDATEKLNKAYSETVNIAGQITTVLAALVEKEKQRAAAAAASVATLEAQDLVESRHLATLVELAKQQGTALDIQKALQAQHDKAIASTAAIAEAKAKEATAAQGVADALKLQYQANLLNIGLSAEELAKSKAAADQAQDLANKKRAVAKSSADLAEAAKQEIITLDGVITAREKEIEADTLVQQAMLALALARGDSNKAAEISLQLAVNEVEKAKEKASVLQAEARETANLVTKLQDEYAARLELSKIADPNTEKQIAAAQTRAKIAADEAAAAQKDIELKQQQARQAEIMAGPIGQLTRLYAEQTKEHERAGEASDRYQDAQVKEAEGALKLAQIKGDAQEIDKAQAALDDQKISQAQAIAATRQQEAIDAENAVAAKRLELTADGELTKADKEQIASMEAVAAAKRDSAKESQNAADQLGAETDAKRQAAEATKAAAEKENNLKEETEKWESAGKAAAKTMNDGLGILEKTGGEMDKLTKRFYEQQGEITKNAAGWDGWAAGTARAAQEVKQAYENQKAAITGMDDALKQFNETGIYNANVQQAMIQAGGDLASQFDLMDQQSFDNLRGSLEQANQKLRDMQQEAQDAADRLAELNAEIAAERGDTATADRLKLELQQRQALADIDAKIREAEMQGNTTLLAALEEQRRKLEELYALKERNLEKDIQARKEQERTAKSKSDTSSSSGSSSSGSSSGSSSSGGGMANKSSGFSLTINTTGGVIDKNFAEDLARKIKPALDDISRRST